MKSNKFLIAFILLLTAGFSTRVRASESCQTLSAEVPLHLTYPAQSGLMNPVDVRFEISGNLLKAHFNVRAAIINAKDVLGPNEYPYQHDVVEIFLSVAGPESDHLPYYEFEVSPLGQTFQVEILNLKKPFINNVATGLQHVTAKTSEGWSADLIIPLANLKWDGQTSHIIGNAYAIQGVSPARSFWSLFLPPQLKPNFHQPQYFKPFFKCEPTAN